MNDAAAFGAPNATAIIFFLSFVALTLLITWWAARRTHTTEDFLPPGAASAAGRTVLRSRAIT